TMKNGSEFMAYTPRYGDLSPGRVGNGTVVYDVPVKGGAYRTGALAVENLDDRAARVKDAARPGVLILRMPSSYVSLDGVLTFTGGLGAGGKALVSYSDTNGLDGREPSQFTAPGSQPVDLARFVRRRYDYRLKFEFRGKGTGLDALKIVHNIQH